MAELDLYKDRKYHSIFLDVNGERTAFRIPGEYTVAEYERILEIQAKLDEYVKENKDKDADEVGSPFWDLVYDQLVILFQRYQPEVTLEMLKGLISREETLRINQFFIENRFLEMKDDSKKKDQQKSPSEISEGQ